MCGAIARATSGSSRPRLLVDRNKSIATARRMPPEGVVNRSCLSVCFVLNMWRAAQISMRRGGAPPLSLRQSTVRSQSSTPCVFYQSIG